MKNNYNFYKNILHENLGGNCSYCGVGDSLHVHHIVPRILGGTNKMTNLELVCDKCHYDLHKQLRKILPSRKTGISSIDEYVKLFGFNK